jgi:O-antigen/teichoic acid export membrane protein
LINTFFQNLYPIIIGKLFSATSLGFYTTAKKIQSIPPTTISKITNRVFFPVLSLIQDDDYRAKSVFKSILKMIGFINIPLMMGLAVIARPLTIITLTEKWLQVASYLQLLCIIGTLMPFQTLNLNALKAKGRSDLILRLEIIKKTLVVISILSTYRWGVSALILGQAVVAILSFFLNSYYAGKIVGYSFKEQIYDLSPYFSLATVMAFSVYSLSFLTFSNIATLLIVQLFAGATLYLLLNILFKTFAINKILSHFSGE